MSVSQEESPGFSRGEDVNVVAALLGRQRWRCAHCDHPPVHRTAADTTQKTQDCYVVRAILSRPERRGLSRIGSESAQTLDTFSFLKFPAFVR